MDEPLVGTPQNNYRFFYGASASAITSLVVLFVINRKGIFRSRKYFSVSFPPSIN